VLTIPTLGLSWIWYAAFKHRHFWNHTSIAGMRFQSSVTGGELLMLQVTNILLAIATLGIGTAWVVTRTKAFYMGNLVAEGVIDWPAIHDRMQRASGVSEGLAAALDVEVGLGM
jgi:uncharacterized membrane protein YjgN (DUF898 family)